MERRNRTIHSRMREYLYTLTHHPELTTSVLPLGDGVTLSVKRETAGSSRSRDETAEAEKENFMRETIEKAPR